MKKYTALKKEENILKSKNAKDWKKEFATKLLLDFGSDDSNLFVKG